MIKIIEKSINELIPYGNNARHNDKAVEVVAKSIQEFGFLNPIIIDKNNIIVAGHTRLKAAEKLGLKKVPCIVADDLTDEQIKAFRIADNSTAQIAEWDLEKLNEELLSIDFDMSEFGLAEQILEIEKRFSVYDDIDKNKYKSEADILTLNINGEKVIMTEDEYRDLSNKLKHYVDVNGVSFGFVRWLLNG